ncbi:hypothetical protein MAR_027112 [Mya arenaria]|uniref:Uncharacterized protein n=1 Tax=Mya arenaria TaxID=6604 RepID=A0ABY7EUM0_MYAAR|nr:hypothetical protein MAR_027112 [Mya arenaria]
MEVSWEIIYNNTILSNLSKRTPEIRQPATYPRDLVVKSHEAASRPTPTSVCIAGSAVPNCSTSQACRKMLMACLLAGVVSQPMGMGDCPEGQIFCFMRERCVNLDGTCPDHLSCGDHENWTYLDTSDGFPQCRPTDILFGNEVLHVARGEGYVCWQNARQECVPDDQCHFLSVTFQINASFPEVIGPNWEHFDSALAHIQNSTAAVLSVNRGMVFGLYAWEGSIWVHFGVPPELRSAIEALFYDQQRQFLANDDWSLDIVWGSLSIYEHLPITNPGDNPDMGSHCSDGMIYCLMTRQCVSINGAVPDCDSNMPCADYEVLCKDDMGGYYCSDQDCHGSSGNIQCPEGEIYCLMSKQCVNEVDASCSEQSFCSDFEYLDVTDGYPQCKYNDESCPYGEVCWRNDRQECVPDHECRSLAVMFMINGVFGDVFGVQMEHYDPVIGYIRAAIAASLSIEPAMMFNFQAWEGSIWVRFEAPEELWNAIEALFNGTMGQFLSDTTWNLDIDFGSVHMERLYGGERCPYGMNMCMNGTGSYYCSNMNCEEPEGMQQCPDDQVQCMGSFGNYYCSDNGCDEEVGTCPSDQRNPVQQERFTAMERRHVCQIQPCVQTPSTNLVMFMINGVFGDVFGVQMEHYDPVIGYIRAAIAASLSIEPAMMFNFQAWEGSIWVRFEAPEELWNAIEALFNGTVGQFLSDTTWNLDIDFGSVHMERLYGGERCPYGMNMCMNGTGSYYCSNMNCEEPEGMQQCPDDQVQCMGSFGNYYCSDNGCDEEEESCPAGEIYCHGTKACVSDTTLCADSFHEPRCPYAYKVCWRNNQQECVPDNECPSLAVEFRINGVFDEVFGVHMEHYEAVIGHIRTAIASSLSLVEQVDPGMLFGFDAWEGSELALFFFSEDSLERC